MAFAAQQPGRGNEAICELSDENQRLRALIQQRNHEIVRLTSELHAQPSGLLEAAGSRARSQPRYWSAEEHERFLQGLNRYGPKAFKSIATFVGTRTATQVRTHAQKYFCKLQAKGQHATARSQDTTSCGDTMSLGTEGNTSSSTEGPDGAAVSACGVLDAESMYRECLGYGALDPEGDEVMETHDDEEDEIDDEMTAQAAAHVRDDVAFGAAIFSPGIVGAREDMGEDSLVETRSVRGLGANLAGHMGKDDLGFEEGYL